MWNKTMVFQIAVLSVGIFFLFFGLDVRPRKAARNFVGRGWQTFMKLCSFSLLIFYVTVALLVRLPAIADWLALALMASGTAFVVAAKGALGAGHTFTGQYHEKPALVTGGVYAFTRNPLYFGVLLCELGASLLVAHQAPLVFTRSHFPWLITMSGTLFYAIAFNWVMASREASYLRHYFGEAYVRYSRSVPFLIPRFRSAKEER